MIITNFKLHFALNFPAKKKKRMHFQPPAASMMAAIAVNCVTAAENLHTGAPN